VRSIDEIGEDLRRASDTNDADVLLRLATELDDIGTLQANATAYRARGWALFLRGDFAPALEHFHQALDIFRELGDHSSIARVTANIGVVHDSTGDHPAALERHHHALSTYEELGDDNGVAYVSSNIGITHFNTGDYPAALEHYHRALGMFEALGDSSGVARATGNIGIVFARTGDHTAAFDYYHRALALHEAHGDRAGIARVSGNIGLLHGKIGDHVAALEHYRRAHLLHQEVGAHSNVVLISCNILRTYIDMGSNDAAQEQLEALDAMHIENPIVRIIREQCRAALQERHDDLHGATSTLHHALIDARNHGLRHLTAETHKLLRELALKRDDLASYVEHNNEYTRITEETNGKDTATKLAMQAKQREIDAVQREHAQHMAVLHATLPKHVAERVVRGEQVNDHFTDAAILFVDIVEFTSHTSSMDAAEVVGLLEGIFSTFDAICQKHDVTKVKTIGDSYMCFKGDADAPTNAESIANAGIDIMTCDFTWPDGTAIMFRSGIHCGPAAAGVIGSQRLQYDVWGDTVNVASRMESSSEPGRIHVSNAFATVLRSVSDPAPYTLTPRGMVEIKGKGEMQTWWLEP
jgi:adenylate cyclase